MEEYESEIKITKALTHPTRIAILDILRDGEQCVCHMEAILGLRQAYISQQLMVLRDAGLLQDRRDGWNIYYRIIRPEIYSVLDAVRQMAGKPALSPANLPIACDCPTCKNDGAQIAIIPAELTVR
jgi:ArsR family transcriptional regulator